MNANRQRFWMIADDGQWHRWEDPATLAWDRSRRVLRLAGQREVPPQAGSPQLEGELLLTVPSEAVDTFGSRAFWDFEAGQLKCLTPDLPDEVILFDAQGALLSVSDLAMGHDGILYLAVDDKVGLYDPRQRWNVAPVGSTEIKAARLAPRAAGGAWVLDRSQNRFGIVRGTPLPHRPFAPYDDDTWRPSPEEPDPPRLVLLFELDLDPGEVTITIASGPGNRVALLSWRTINSPQARIRLLREDGRAFGPPLSLLRTPWEPLAYAWSLAWLSESRVAVMAPGLTEAPAYDLEDRPGDDPQTLLPTGDLYPLPDHDGRPFLKGPALPVHYPVAGSSTPLHRLSFPSYATQGKAANLALLDSGSTHTEWHRLYLEACIPPGCGIRVELAASDTAAVPMDPDAWHEHRFGLVPGSPGDRVPRGAWVSYPSELPFHPGLLPCPPEADRAGLFTCLIQRAGLRVTALSGRYLWVRVELLGTGRSTPELAAVRAWGSRFSYADRYLPELYREDLLGPEGDDEGPSTPADFLERFLGNFEGVLTALEDRVAASYLLTDPRTVPEDALEWLGSWIGMAFEPGYPPERRRRLLRAAPELYRWRGTLRGLQMALDVATGGAVQGGEVIVLEEYRLRRTFATILGVDLAREEDPLLGGLSVSGNSYVGDTLFLGDDRQREFLALFGEDLPMSRAEERAVQAFFERLAHRATVIVHQEVEPQDLGLIRRVAVSESPAHVRVRVITASRPFIVGLASLVGVETYLGPRLGLTPVTINRSSLGLRDYLLGPGSLDPRLGGGEIS